MKIRFPELKAAGEVGIALVAAVVVVTCSSRGEYQAAPPAFAPSISAKSSQGGSPVAAAPAPSAATLSDASPSGEAAPSDASRAPELRRFHAALQALERGSRSEPVRVLWLGDSHTAADFLPDAARAPLQARYGNGGPGYLMVGLHPYRHAGVAVERSGDWLREPPSPAGRSRQKDGVFGLNGLRTAMRSADASARLEPRPGAVPGRARWTVLFRAQGAARFTVKLAGDVHTLDANSGSAGPTGSPIRRLKLESGPTDALEIRAGQGRPEIFGVILESSEPGVVVDTLGINGARIATPLAWSEGEWAAEVGARAPELVVLSYGTNEVFDARRPDAYAGQLKHLHERLQRGAPDADCLVIGPTDTARERDGVNERISDIEAMLSTTARGLGCGYFSLVKAMGGSQGFERWLDESPPLAAPDGIHLKPAGYAKLGSQVAEKLMAGLPPSSK